MSNKKLSLLLAAALLSNVLFAQTNKKTQDYISKYAEFAVKEMARSGVPASITLAQGILESGYGESEIAVKGNNHFGIKCKTEWTGEKIYRDDDERNECFRVYPSVQASYADHSDFLKSRPWYASLFKLDPTDYEGWAKGLQKAGYATDKKYPEKLIKIITENNLQQFNVAGVKLMENPTAPVFTTPVTEQKTNEKEEEEVYNGDLFGSIIVEGDPSSKNKTEEKKIDTIKQVVSEVKSAPAANDTVIIITETKTIVEPIITEQQKKDTVTVITETKTITQPIVTETVTETVKNINNDTVIETTTTVVNTGITGIAYPEGEFKINGCRVVFAPANTSLLALANKYKLTYQKLISFNDMEKPEDILAKGQLIFLERKSKKGNIDFCTAQTGQTLYDISQQQGVRLSSIKEYNYTLTKIPNLKPGERVYLKGYISSPNKKQD